MKDIHYHIMEPHSIVIPDRFWMPALENAQCLVESMELFGLAAVNIPSISLYDAEDFVCNPLALYAKTLAPGRVYALAGLRYEQGMTAEKLLDQAQALLDAGFDGFKMICKPNVRRVMKIGIDDPLFEAFFSEAEKAQWPILYHVGDPAPFWDPKLAPDWCKASGWYYGDDPTLPTYEDLYEEVERMMSRHPLLRVTFAHFFFLSGDFDRLDDMFERYPNMRVDVTPGREMYVDFAANADRTRAFFAKHKGRILLGTDNDARCGDERPKAEQAGKAKLDRLRRFYETDELVQWGEEELQGLKLPADVLHALYEGAFDAFLKGNPPKTVDAQAARALCLELKGTAVQSVQWRAELEALYDDLAAVF